MTGHIFSLSSVSITPKAGAVRLPLQTL